jgi:hypothetical protein
MYCVIWVVLYCVYCIVLCCTVQPVLTLTNGRSTDDDDDCTVLYCFVLFRIVGHVVFTVVNLIGLAVLYFRRLCVL